MLRPDRPHTPTDGELAQAARNALSPAGGDPAMLVRDALGAAGAYFGAYEWLYEYMVPQLMGLATERAVAAWLHVLDAALEPANHPEHRSLRNIAAEQASVHFEANHIIIDSLSSDLDEAISHGTRAALHRHLQDRAARSHVGSGPQDGAPRAP